MEKQEIGIYGREKMFMRKKENELQIDWKHFYLGVRHWSFRWHFRI